MRCPYCGEDDDRVVDSRESRKGRAIRRRRECARCERRFTTYERIEDIPFMVIKTDGTREVFDRVKLLSGLNKACEKRPVPARRLDEIVEAVEHRLLESEERELSTREIGTMVMDALRHLDQVAYVRFASVYRNFEDLGAFMDELKGLLRKEKERDR